MVNAFCGARHHGADCFAVYVDPKRVFPLQDSGIIQGSIESRQSISFAAMAQKQQEVASKLLADPAVDNVTTYVGVDGNNPTLNNARLQITLKPLDEREDRVVAIIDRLQQSVDNIAGVNLYLQPMQDLTIDTQVARTQYQFTLQAGSLEELTTWVPRLLDALEQQPELTDVSSDWQNKGLVAYVNVNRDTASRFGITMSAIDNALYNAFGQRMVSTIYTQSNQYRVILEHDTQTRDGMDALNDIRLKGTDGAIVPLSTLVNIQEGNGPLAINHLDQFPR